MKTVSESADELTSERRLHGCLHHTNKQLQTLGVLGQARGKCCQGIGMATQVLQSNPLAKVGLQERKNIYINRTYLRMLHFDKV